MLHLGSNPGTVISSILMLAALLKLLDSQIKKDVRVKNEMMKAQKEAKEWESSRATKKRKLKGHYQNKSS